MTARNEFTTPDLYFAAFLQASGLPMVRTERRQGNRIYFVFDTSKTDIEALKTGWFNNTATVPAQPYSHSIKGLKSLCHTG